MLSSQLVIAETTEIEDTIDTIEMTDTTDTIDTIEMTDTADKKRAKVKISYNTCRLRVKGEGEKGQEKTFNPYPLTFSPNPIPS
uniref:hypothetical protein n=1 Tax=unclassified Tolypothrix TaxID=2649714 RepID=UPI001F1A2D41|nr:MULTISPECIES: hypothetical protein [unclassified Tolypothrix]